MSTGKARLPVFAAICTAVLILGGWEFSGSSSAADSGALSAATRGRLANAAMKEYERNGNVQGGGKTYWEYWGKPPEPWCVDFIYYCADQIGLVGADRPFGAYTAGCVTAWQQMKARGAAVFPVGADVPQAGDIVFWYDTDGGCAAALDDPSDLCHVGIVIDYSEKEETLTTIEGNTGGLGSEQNYVAMNTYANLEGPSWNGAAIFGFVRLSSGIGGLTEMVKQFEGFAKYPVWDYSQWSVGYGTVCPPDKLEEYRSNGISEEAALALLEQHLASAVEAVDGYRTEAQLPLSPVQRDALASLTYNIGTGWMTGSGYTLLRSVIAEPSNERMVVQAFANISHAGGNILPALVQRRICEAHLFLTGEYVTDYTRTGYTYTISGNVVSVAKGGF